MEGRATLTEEIPKGVRKALSVVISTTNRLVTASSAFIVKTTERRASSAPENGVE
jgi:hypothetical protein